MDGFCIVVDFLQVFVQVRDVKTTSCYRTIYGFSVFQTRCSRLERLLMNKKKVPTTSKASVAKASVGPLRLDSREVPGEEEL